MARYNLGHVVGPKGEDATINGISEATITNGAGISVTTNTTDKTITIAANNPSTTGANVSYTKPTGSPLSSAATTVQKAIDETATLAKDANITASTANTTANAANTLASGIAAGTTNILYSGNVSGATNVKEAIDELASSANTINNNLGTSSASAGNGSAFARIKQLETNMGTSSDTNSASGSIYARVKNAQSTANNIASGTTNITYTAANNTELTSTNVKAAIDELGLRTNSANLQSSVDTKVANTLSTYTFTIDANDNLILTIPD